MLRLTKRPLVWQINFLPPIIGLIGMLFILGISPISYYLVDILKRGDVALDPEWSAVGVGIIETIGK